jgi:hypothetical protein
MINFPQTKSLAVGIALVAGLSVASVAFVTPAEAESVNEEKAAASLSVVMDFLSNTTPDKVDAAAERLVAPNATYVSLNFDNPELRMIMPWTGTNQGPKAYSGLFKQVSKYWTIQDFTITDRLAVGENVAIFGLFTYRSVAVGHVFTSPFSIHAKVRDGKMVYFQFMEDTYASASSFRQSGSWTVKTTEDAAAFTVGTK